MPAPAVQSKPAGLTPTHSRRTLGPPTYLTGSRVFVIALLAAKPHLGNAFIYGELASGATYVESDPIGLWGGLNTYSYAGANPVMLIDPEGTNPAAAARGGYAIGGIANAGLNAWLLRATGATLGGLIYEACHDSEDEKLRKRCQALKDSILNTCAGLQGRARMRCFEAANTSYRQCMGWE